MINRSRFLLASCVALAVSAPAVAQQAGTIRGTVTDADFPAPVAMVIVQIAETGERLSTTDQGTFVFQNVRPGKYTLVFTKEGYIRQVKTDVVVGDGQLVDVPVQLPGEIEEMEDFIAQDLQIGGAEAALLKLRLDSPAFVDGVDRDMISRSLASDAANALRLVAGATVQDGKFAVVRGLPDRYVNSQINGIRLPTADEDKRAVQLDQYPSSVIDSIVVSKTFTPDQQGDASGGAVNVLLRGIPEQTAIQFRSTLSFNTNSAGRDDFLTYQGGGVSALGRDDGRRDQQLDKLGQNWDGAAGVTRGGAPTDYKWALSGGGKFDADDGVKIGGFANVFYERNSSFYDNGIDDSYWVTTPGAGLTPETVQGTPSDGDFKTKLFDVTSATETVQWGALGTFGVETENHQVAAAYLFTRTTDDEVTLAEDTRGKRYYFPDYDPNDPTSPGNTPATRAAAPYIRTETLTYTERDTTTVQLRGKHKLAFDEWELSEYLTALPPELDWSLSKSIAELNQPDKRQFGSLWLAETLNPGFPPFLPPFTQPAIWLPFKPAANFTLGNFQRIWKDIRESSDQYAVNLKLPFKQWTDSEGYLKFGVFDDRTTRKFNQDTFSNFNDAGAQFFGDFSDFWSASFPSEFHPITDGPPLVDVDYIGKQNISAWYAMADVPLTDYLNIIGGARFESTQLSIINTPEANATWFPLGSSTPVALNPGDADVDYNQDDVLPSVGLVIKPIELVTLRASYSETVARQTYKELTPIQQQEFLGGDVFIGNPDLRMSALKNYDFRADWTPTEGTLLSASWFYKDVRDPIEYVQRVASFTYTTPVNYPKGKLSGFEFEARQKFGDIWEELTGLSAGANFTLIDSSVNLPLDEIAALSLPNIAAPMTSREMTGAPEYLYNLYLTYDIEETGTQFSIFYTGQGDSLVAGAGQSPPNFIPSVYALGYGTLNFSIAQKLGEYIKLQFQVKNLTDPKIREVYRSEYIGGDVLKTSYSKGVDLAIGLFAEIPF